MNYLMSRARGKKCKCQNVSIVSAQKMENERRRRRGFGDKAEVEEGLGTVGLKRGRVSEKI
jgi:hypothetical protein